MKLVLFNSILYQRIKPWLKYINRAPEIGQQNRKHEALKHLLCSTEK